MQAGNEPERAERHRNAPTITRLSEETQTFLPGGLRQLIILVGHQPATIEKDEGDSLWVIQFSK